MMGSGGCWLARVSLPITRAAAVLLAALVTDCGYQVISGAAPYGMNRLLLLPLAEEEPVGLSPALTEALAERLAADGVTLTTDQHAAQGVLTGRVWAVTTAPSPTAGIGSPVPSYDLNVRVEVSLSDAKGKEIWSSTLTIKEGFLPATAGPGADTLASEANRRQALNRVASRAAHDIHQQLVFSSQLATKGSS